MFLIYYLLTILICVWIGWYFGPLRFGYPYFLVDPRNQNVADPTNPNPDPNHCTGLITELMNPFTDLSQMFIGELGRTMGMCLVFKKVG